MKKTHTPLIITVNAGSSSMKFSLFDLQDGMPRELLFASFKDLHSEKRSFVMKSTSLNYFKEEHPSFSTPFTIKEATLFFLEQLFTTFDFCKKDIKAIGHRCVHGGKAHKTSCKLTKNVLRDLHTLNALAPLHNQATLDAIEAISSYFGEGLLQVAVFDTAFHRTMPDVATHYAIEKSLAEQHGIYRYGFHGISHEYLWNAYAAYTKKTKGCIITCHLGNGASLCAIKDGKSLDTTMGFTPTEGLVMATRSGDIDPEAALFLCEKEHLPPRDVMNIFNQQSGLLGLSKISGNMQELLPLYEINPLCTLSIDLFCYRIVKYIGAFTAVLGSLDALIFSAGIGENIPYIRKKIIERLSFLGIDLDPSKNEGAKNLNRGDVHQISKGNSPQDVYVIATDENALIAEKTALILANDT